jgi:hypothetical protein
VRWIQSVWPVGFTAGHLLVLAVIRLCENDHLLQVSVGSMWAHEVRGVQHRDREWSMARVCVVAFDLCDKGTIYMGITCQEY